MDSLCDLLDGRLHRCCWLSRDQDLSGHSENWARVSNKAVRGAFNLLFKTFSPSFPGHNGRTSFVVWQW
jgi:hypothetical protein